MLVVIERNQCIVNAEHGIGNVDLFFTGKFYHLFDQRNVFITKVTDNAAGEIGQFFNLRVFGFGNFFGEIIKNIFCDCFTLVRFGNGEPLPLVHKNS